MVTLEDLPLDELDRRTYTGYAYELNSDAFIYTEHHEEFRRDGVLLADRVTYKKPDGSVIAQKVVRFDQNTVAPDFLKEDYRTGFQEGATQDKTHLTLLLKRTADGDMKKTKLQKPEDLVIDAGFNQYVIQHWDALLKGKRQVFKFAIPTRNEYFQFRLEKSGTEQIEGRETVVFRMALNAFLFRLFVDDIIVGYDAETKSLSFYKGLSNIRDNDGELYKAMIKFPQDEYKTIPAS